MLDVFECSVLIGTEFQYHDNPNMFPLLSFSLFKQKVQFTMKVCLEMFRFGQFHSTQHQTSVAIKLHTHTQLPILPGFQSILMCLLNAINRQFFH